MSKKTRTDYGFGADVCHEAYREAESKCKSLEAECRGMQFRLGQIRLWATFSRRYAPENRSPILDRVIELAQLDQ